MSFRVVPYSSADAALWNQFVRGSRNGTFLFDRGYMDYHADRFVDTSAIVYDSDGKVLALFPANATETGVASHGGLTYGGLVTDARMTTPVMLEVFAALLDHYRALGHRKLTYKTVPWIYHRHPAEEDRYALFRHDAALTRRDVLTVIPARERLPMQERRRRGIKKAGKAGLAIEPSTDFADFWEVLDANLRARYGVGPVHSLAEIERLAACFPEAIRLYIARDGGGLVAGVVVYESERVAHVQYISADARGRELHALDAVFDHLINGVYAQKPWFDFGISNEDAGRTLNVGLIEQKEGFGARAVVHDFYDVSLA